MGWFVVWRLHFGLERLCKKGMKIDMNSNLLAMQHYPQKFGKPDWRSCALFWFSSTLSPAAQSGLIVVIVIRFGLRCYWSYWPAVTITITTSFIIFAVAIDLCGPLVLLALLPDLTMAKWREGERGGWSVIRGLWEGKWGTFLVLKGEYPSVTMLQSVFRGGVWFSPK